MGFLAAWLFSGCATIGLMEVTDPKNRARRTAEWSIREVDAAYVSSEQELLVCVTGRAPRTARFAPYSLVFSLVPYGTDPTVFDRAETHAAHDTTAMHRGERMADDDPSGPPSALQPVGKRRALRLRHEAALGTRDIFAGWPDFDSLAENRWTPVIVPRLAPCPSGCDGGCRMRNLLSDESADGGLYFPICGYRPATLVYTARGLKTEPHDAVVIRPQELHYDGPSREVLRIFLPVTVAFDIITSPIQGVVLLYVLHNMSWF